MGQLTPDMLEAGQGALQSNARLASGDSAEEIVTAVYIAMDAERPSEPLEDVVGQLTRYGGEPDSRVLALVRMLTDLNDDIWHMRDLSAPIAALRQKLNEIEQNPALA